MTTISPINQSYIKNLSTNTKVTAPKPQISNEDTINIQKTEKKANSIKEQIKKLYEKAKSLPKKKKILFSIIGVIFIGALLNLKGKSANKIASDVINDSKKIEKFTQSLQQNTQDIVEESQKKFSYAQNLIKQGQELNFREMVTPEGKAIFEVENGVLKTVKEFDSNEGLLRTTLINQSYDKNPADLIISENIDDACNRYIKLNDSMIIFQKNVKKMGKSGEMYDECYEIFDGVLEGYKKGVVKRNTSSYKIYARFDDGKIFEYSEGFIIKPSGKIQNATRYNYDHGKLYEYHKDCVFDGNTEKSKVYIEFENEKPKTLIKNQVINEKTFEESCSKKYTADKKGRLKLETKSQEEK